MIVIHCELLDATEGVKNLSWWQRWWRTKKAKQAAQRLYNAIKEASPMHEHGRFDDPEERKDLCRVLQIAEKVYFDRVGWHYVPPYSKK